MLLVLKLILVPGLVASANLAERRWGPRIAGLLTSFPIVTDPILLYFAIEQGAPFTAEASRGALVALVAVAGSGLILLQAVILWWMQRGVSPRERLGLRLAALTPRREGSRR